MEIEKTSRLVYGIPIIRTSIVIRPIATQMK